MNIKKALIFLVIVFVLTAAGTEWKLFTSESGGFSVRFPREPEKQTEQVNMPVGEGYKKINMYMIMVRDPGFTYLVVYNEMPEWNPEDADYIFDQARDGGIASLNGKLISEKDIRLDSHPGREIKLNNSKGLYYRSRMYLVEDRFFQISVTTLEKEAASSNIAKFLNSFELLSEEDQDN